MCLSSPPLTIWWFTNDLVLLIPLSHWSQTSKISYSFSTSNLCPLWLKVLGASLQYWNTQQRSSHALSSKSFDFWWAWLVLEREYSSLRSARWWRLKELRLRGSRNEIFEHRLMLMMDDRHSEVGSGPKVIFMFTSIESLTFKVPVFT